MKTNHTTLVISIFVAVGCGCGSKVDSKAARDEAHARCAGAPQEKACSEWGRKALSEFPTEVAAAEAEKAEISRLAANLKSEDLLGLQGAYTAKLGGLYADKKDVVKAVECVEDGLGVMLKGIKDHPESKTLRIYYVATISSLPDVFKKRQETLDSIASLRARFKLTDSEAKIVQDAQDRASKSGK